MCNYFIQGQHQMRIPLIKDHYIRFERPLSGEQKFFLYHHRKGYLVWRFWVLILDLDYS